MEIGLELLNCDTEVIYTADWQLTTLCELVKNVVVNFSVLESYLMLKWMVMLNEAHPRHVQHERYEMFVMSCCVLFIRCSSVLVGGLSLTLPLHIHCSQTSITHVMCVVYWQPLHSSCNYIVHLLVYSAFDCWIFIIRDQSWFKGSGSKPVIMSYCHSHELLELLPPAKVISIFLSVL